MAAFEDKYSTKRVGIRDGIKSNHVSTKFRVKFDVQVSFLDTVSKDISLRSKDIRLLGVI